MIEAGLLIAGGDIPVPVPIASATRDVSDPPISPAASSPSAAAHG